MKKNCYSVPEAKEFELRLAGELLTLSKGTPDVIIREDDEDNTFA